MRVINRLSTTSIEGTDKIIREILKNLISLINLLNKKIHSELWFNPHHVIFGDFKWLKFMHT